jgi:hypothetical protein
MIYDYAIPTPANTPESAPVETVITLPPGRLAHVDILFPSGCAGLAHVQIYRALHQLWPANAGGSFIGDGQVVSWDDDYMLTDEPLDLVAVTWNDDDTYPHTITVRINVLDTDTFSAGAIVSLRPEDLV